jgi:hypothetical protein
MSEPVNVIRLISRLRAALQTHCIKGDEDRGGFICLECGEHSKTRENFKHHKSCLLVEPVKFANR